MKSFMCRYALGIGWRPNPTTPFSWRSPVRNFLALAGFVVLATGPTASSESLTVSRVDLPVDPADRPFCVSLTEDGKLIAFQSARSGGFGQQDIWFSRLEDGRWSEPYNAGPGINTDINDVDAKLSPDGTVMVLVRSADFRKSTQLYISHLRDGKWENAEPIGPPVSPPDTIEFGALLSRDGKRLYFASNREGGHGGTDLYYSDRTGDAWAEPVNLGSTINSKHNEADLALSRDGNTIIFPSTRADSIADSTDLYISRRMNGAWSTPENLGPRVNTPGTDTCPWLGHDGQTLYLNSDWSGLLQGEKGPLLVWKIHYSTGF